MLTKKQERVGYIELALAQTCVGINVISGKFLISLFPVFLLLALRFAIGFFGMLIIEYFRSRKLFTFYSQFIALNFRDKCLLMLQAICGGLLFNVLVLYGMKTTSATSAGIITSITPVMIFILAAVFLREKINRQKIISIIMVVIGLVILNTGKSVDLRQGALLGSCLILLSVFPEAFFTILSKSVGKKITEIDAVILVNFFNLILFIPLAWLDRMSFHLNQISFTTLIQVMIYGISGGIVFFLLWYRGLTKINANTAALFTAIMPVSTTLFAFLFLKEAIHIRELIGMLFVILAIFVGCKKLSLKSHTAEFY